jgi:tetratricopeptide (TPR) repeat protein
VVENRWLRNLGHLPEVFRKGVWGFAGEEQSNYYRPLMHVSYILTYAAFGLRPWAFHLVNILFHAAVSALVFLTGRRLYRSSQGSPAHFSAFLAALLFAAHPIHTEAVTWVAGIPELFFTLFYLLAFYLYIRAVDEVCAHRVALYLLSLAFFFLSTLSKETALTLPIALAAYDLIFGRRPFRPVVYIWRYLPYLVVAAVYFMIRTAVLGGFAHQKRHTELSSYEYLINVFPLIGQYFAKLVLPINLNVFHEFHPIHSILQMQGILSLAVICAFVFFGLLFFRRQKLACFAMALIVIPLLPVLYIPALGENTFTERYLYLPSIGYVLLFSIAVAWLRGRRAIPEAALTLAVASILVSYAVATLGRNPVWRDDLALWSDTVEKSPNSVLPRNELGIAYATRGESQKAIEQYRAALRLRPNFADGYTNLGLLYDEVGMLDMAVRYHQEALRLKPTSAEAHSNLGLALAKMGMPGKAMPLSPGVHNNLGNAYQSLGLLDKAIDEYLEASRLQPDFVDTYINLAVAYGRKGMIDEAIAQLESARAVAPKNPVVHHNLANAYWIKGLPEKAEEHKQKAKELELALPR